MLNISKSDDHHNKERKSDNGDCESRAPLARRRRCRGRPSKSGRDPGIPGAGPSAGAPASTGAALLDIITADVANDGSGIMKCRWLSSESPFAIIGRLNVSQLQDAPCQAIKLLVFMALIGI